MQFRLRRQQLPHGLDEFPVIQFRLRGYCLFAAFRPLRIALTLALAFTSASCVHQSCEVGPWAGARVNRLEVRRWVRFPTAPHFAFQFRCVDTFF